MCVSVCAKNRVTVAHKNQSIYSSNFIFPYHTFESLNDFKPLKAFHAVNDNNIKQFDLVLD